MKRVDSEQWPGDSKPTALGAAPIVTNRYPSGVIIIGYGNPLRSDDGFGWHAARLVAETLARRNVGASLVGALENVSGKSTPTTASPPDATAGTGPAQTGQTIPVTEDRAGTRPAPTTGVEVITCHQLTPELAERLSQCRLAIFLDADSEGTPGEIHTCELLPEAPNPTSFTHVCTPSGLLASSQQLYGHCPQAFAITVSAATFDFGETLSPAVAASIPKVVEQVNRLVDLAASKTSP